MKGYISIGEIAARIAMLDVECRRCPRRGRLSMARLLREHGPDAPLWDATEHLSDDCPNKNSASWYARCSVNYPQLSRLFLR